ncbi:putative PEP-binding protein [Streptomyces sp. NBC_01314]|uniref:putative PEP-binding protein n=1 Tax=Streptomyces sp. NBC_01314 TaxID=2903821 RepID=UPI00352F0BF3
MRPSRPAARSGPGFRSRLKIGVCGKHGGAPESVDFFHAAGLDCISCPPLRGPAGGRPGSSAREGGR